MQYSPPPLKPLLTPDELTAYKALTTYAPNTVVQAADGAGVKAGLSKRREHRDQKS